ncbi:MAG: hypothetical protein GX057_05890 [Clostridiales bacterium]|nr:hypothetical protein [Clostridiales bacterium]HOA85042.1 hypothetical protein [Bacillota bacterium]
MISKKYTNDYKIENVLLPDGRVVSRPVYCGKYYGFSADPHNVRRARLSMTLSAAVYWVFFWAGLCFRSGAMKQWYVSLPYFCGFLPAAFLTGSLYYLWLYTLKPPAPGLTREQKDRLYTRISQCSFTMLLFGALAAAGLVIYYLLGAEGYAGFGDILAVVSAFTMIISTAVVFSARKHTKTQVIP